VKRVVEVPALGRLWATFLTKSW